MAKAGGSQNDQHKNDLNVWNGAALLVADCMGTGLLALPHDVQVLGRSFGLFFLIANLPINYGAGLILSYAADHVEQQQQQQQNDSTEDEETCARKATQGLLSKHPNATTHTSYQATVLTNEPDDRTSSTIIGGGDLATFDFVGMASAIFRDPAITRLIMLLYYVNIFLVLGNYIVVMSHAVIALFGNGDTILSCKPIAGLFASTLMFAVSQLRTMARLGRSASTISLLALAVVVAQCLYFSRFETNRPFDEERIVGLRLVLRQLSACGSIGFATGSQKLFLNIRHEFADRSDAPKSLSLALAAFGSFYVFIVLTAGSNPPGFLFDAIPQGTIHRQAAGFFLWVHVVVSYAINSQAICASMDRNFFRFWGPVRRWKDEQRWMALTAIMASTAFFVANAVPFFKDLVAFCGALTSVPLTLLLPAVYYRKACERVPIWWPSVRWKSIHFSYSLLVYSTIFMVGATLGSVYSILSDWEHHNGGFFSCQ